MCWCDLEYEVRVHRNTLEQTAAPTVQMFNNYEINALGQSVAKKTVSVSDKAIYTELRNNNEL